MDPIALRDGFNTLLLNTFAGQMFENSVFSLNGGIMSIILTCCFGVGLFQCITRDEKGMMVELAKMAVATWFALGILGHPEASPENYVPFSSMRSQLTAEYQPRGSGKVTIERITFNWVKMKFDAIGEALVDSVGGKTALPMALTSMHFLQLKVVAARTMCNTDDTACMAKYLTSSPDQIEKDKKAEEKKEEEKSSGMLDTLARIANYIGQMFLIFQTLVDPFYWFFPLLIWILQVAQGFINMFVLITFGISAAITMLLTKILSPFLIVPTLRGRVIPLFKKALSVALFGFGMNLVIWISTILVQGLNEATGQFLIKNIAANAGKLAASGDLFVILSSNTFTLIVIMFMQVIAVAKVPKICEQIVNMSFGELASIGQTLLQASFGVSKVLGGLGLSMIPGVGLAAKAAGAVGGRIQQATNTGNPMDAFRGQGQTAGQPGASVPGGSGAGGTGFGGPTSYSGGVGQGAPTPSQQAAAAQAQQGAGGGGINNYGQGGGPAAVIKPTARTGSSGSGDGDSAISQQDRVNAEAMNAQKMQDIENEKSRKSQAFEDFRRTQQIDGFARTAQRNTDTANKDREKSIQAMNEEKSEMLGEQSQGFKDLFVGSLSDMVSDGMGAGLGMGDGTGSMFRGVSRGVNSLKSNSRRAAAFDKREAKATDQFNERIDGIGNTYQESIVEADRSRAYDKTRRGIEESIERDSQQRLKDIETNYATRPDEGSTAAQNAEAYGKMSYAMNLPKQGLSGEEDQQLTAILAQATSGANAAQRRQAQEDVLRMRNTRTLSSDQSSRINNAVASSGEFTSLMQAQTMSNSSLVNSVSTQGFNDTTLKEAVRLVETGMIDAAVLSKINVAGTTNTVAQESMTQQREQMIQFAKELAAKDNYSAAEIQQAQNLVENRSGSILGNTSAIAALEKALPSVNMDHVRRSADEIVRESRKNMQAYTKADRNEPVSEDLASLVDKILSTPEIYSKLDNLEKRMISQIKARVQRNS